MHASGMLLLPNFSLLSIGCSSSKRPCRRTRTSRQQDQASNNEAIPSLARAAVDTSGALVYVDLQRENDTGLNALCARLDSIRPSVRTLEKLSPINRGRILVEVDDAQVLAFFESWLLNAVLDPTIGLLLTSLLSPIGERVRVLGSQFICPKVTEYDRRIVEQTPHTDVDHKGEVFSVAIHLSCGAMGTLINPTASIAADGNGVVGWVGYKRANTHVFAYDTGVVHAGPGRAHVPPPYPQFHTDRVFFLLCADTLDPTRVAQHRRDNGLLGAADRTIQLPSPTNAPNLAANTSRADATVSNGVSMPTATPVTPPHDR